MTPDSVSGARKASIASRPPGVIFLTGQKPTMADCHNEIFGRFSFILFSRPAINLSGGAIDGSGLLATAEAPREALGP